MDATINQNEDGENDEEYVYLDLDEVNGKIDIPPNAPYLISGLDTVNPVLMIGDDIKMIGEYDETIGTCLIFSRTDVEPSVHEETEPSEKNLFMGKGIIDSNKPTKQVKHLVTLHKVLRFKLLPSD